MSLNSQLLRRVRNANAVPNPASLEREASAESLLASILATPIPPDRTRAERDRRFRPRVVAIAAGALVAVLVPTVAVATYLGVFGISNTGQPVDRSELRLDEASALDQGGFADTVRHLGDRAGVAFYVAPGRDGGLCFATGSASGLTPKLNYFIGCQRHSPKAFPSADLPILDMSPLKSPNPSEVVYVRRLVGFAADGVARVGFVAADGAVHSTPVENNIYATDWYADDVAATAIVAFDRDGNILYRKRLLFGTP